MKTLIIDNYDSFTYNLFQLIAQVQGTEPLVIRNDSKEFQTLHPKEYDNIVLSPGPGHPDIPKDFGICKNIILESDKPILGVCLGHQGIFSAFGGQVQRAPIVMHGRLSLIAHQDDPLYHLIPNPFLVTRYHSLICTGPLPPELEITAWTHDQLIMGIRHRHRPIWGIQYHPESIASDYGKQLFINFQSLTEQHYRQQHQTSSGAPKVIASPHSITPPQKAYVARVQKLGFYKDPALVFQQIFSNTTPAVWLDSSQIIPGFSRFSYMGSLEGPLSYHVKYDARNQTTTVHNKQEQITHTTSILDYVQQELQRMTLKTTMEVPFEFHGGFIGYFGYELNQETASIPQTKPSEHPDAQLLFLDRVIVFDHLEQCCYLLAVIDLLETDKGESWFQNTEYLLQQLPESLPHDLHPPSSTSHLESTWLQSKETYLDHIQTCLNFINSGDSYEICLTNKLRYNCHVDPLTYYLNLRQCHPAPHAAYLKFDNLGIACSSMERFLHIDEQGRIQTKPIKGTTPRGQTPEIDKKLARTLQEDEKFRSEHLMIVDLLRNDLGKVCQIGSISVPSLMHVESYATVHQLVSTIEGQLKQGVDAIECIRHIFPGGSMTGAPKIRTMTIINQLETEARGIYSGSIGYLSLNGATDLNIVIRTAEITPHHVSIGAGGAIIALSDPEEEFQEIVLKTRSLHQALLATASQ
ncbi:MAG: aminodeoxychorismate synthase, component I [Legionella sp.]|nr:MAG: aminodeoxychorismate synthase, component I [Legionella sp.]